MAVEEGATVNFWRTVAAALPRPRAVVCVSAHWTAKVARVSAADQPATIHDFGGFPDELYRINYPAAGDPVLALEVAARLQEAGIEAEIDQQRGLDHGAWVPLRRMYPAADVPVLQLSVQPRQSPAAHIAVGRALVPLRAEGVLVLGSGGATHNLSDLFQVMAGESVPAYAEAFMAWLTQCIEANDVASLVSYSTSAPQGARAHPTPEHFLPLFVALGAADGEVGRLLHDEMAFGVLSLAAYGWGLG